MNEYSVSMEAVRRARFTLVNLRDLIVGDQFHWHWSDSRVYEKTRDGFVEIIDSFGHVINNGKIETESYTDRIVYIDHTSKKGIQTIERLNHQKGG